MEQIDLLANFIMAEVEGEPSQDEGAGDCAIRIIKQLKEENKELWDALVEANKMLYSAAKRLRKRIPAPRPEPPPPDDDIKSS